MRLLAIGDIHGCLSALNALLDLVEPQLDDRIVALGDYVDRGTDSRGVLDRLIDLHEAGLLIALRGNHDAMMLEAREGHDLDWLEVGGDTTLRSYDITEGKISKIFRGMGWFGAPEDLLSKVPQRHWTFLEDNCLPYYETEEHIFVHANLYPDVPLADQPDYMLYWERLTEPCAHVSGKTMICGHTRQKSGRPLNLGTTICIDTNVYEDGWLTCLDVHSGRIWQANERGETRTGWLDD